MDKIQKVISFLIENIGKVLPIGELEVSNFTKPDYEITPKEYLHFAKEEINKETLNGNINALGHLKRAVDGQMDCFFEVINLKRIVKNKNLKFDVKISFLQKAGVITANSMKKLNKIRNEMEHEYKQPTEIELIIMN